MEKKNSLNLFPIHIYSFCTHTTNLHTLVRYLNIGSINAEMIDENIPWSIRYGSQYLKIRVFIVLHWNTDIYMNVRVLLDIIFWVVFFAFIL